MAKIRNEIDSREDWLRAATDLIRPEFDKVGETLPDKMRFGIGFTSHGKKPGQSTGEAWPASMSADQTVEVIVHIGKDQPLEVLGSLVHQLNHTVTGKPHGKAFRELALKIGLDAGGGMKTATPGVRLTEFLRGVAEQLGPFPHARLNYEMASEVADRPKKQSTRNLKASCQGEGCGYKCRIAERWVIEVGAPLCPKHGPMHVEIPNEKGDQEITLTATYQSGRTETHVLSSRKEATERKTQLETVPTVVKVEESNE